MKSRHKKIVRLILLFACLYPFLGILVDKALGREVYKECSSFPRMENLLNYFDIAADIYPVITGDGNEISQTFISPYDHITSISVKTGSGEEPQTEPEEGEGVFLVSLKNAETGDIISSWSYDVGKIIHNDVLIFHLDAATEDENMQNGKYELTMKSAGVDANHSVALEQYRGDVYPDGAAIVNGKDTKEDLSFKVEGYFRKSFAYVIFWIRFLRSAILIAVITLISRKRKT